eukprot:4104560-Pleurochrysis_carterae.AAC.1
MYAHVIIAYSMHLPVAHACMRISSSFHTRVLRCATWKVVRCRAQVSTAAEAEQLVQQAVAATQREEASAATVRAHLLLQCAVRTVSKDGGERLSCALLRVERRNCSHVLAGA